MFSQVKSTSLVGIQAVPVFVEAQITSGLKRFTIVGLPDGILREARERVRCAMENSGFGFPHRDLVVSLSPASLPKSGPAFDLPIALSILAANQQVSTQTLQNFFVLGELALDGAIRPVRGALAAAEFVRERNCRRLLVPKKNAREVSLLKGVEAYPVSSLAETVAFLNGELDIKPAQPSLEVESANSLHPNFCDVVGQHAAKRAVEISAAGGHNLLMVGPPGVGKSMIASRLPSIIPQLSEQEAIEVTKIYAASAEDSPGTAPGNYSERLCFARPVRMPHHSTSTAALVGGGAFPRPGDISLAHRGVLFLDELTEFRRDALEALRQPLESKQVTISRAKFSISYPANFILVGAMNPCPCGKRGVANECQCSAQQINRYQAKLSGPILDRIDIQVWVPPVPIDLLARELPKDPTEDMRTRVRKAREIQLQRFNNREILNSLMSPSAIKKHCQLSSSAEQFLQVAATKNHLSARGYNKTIRIARTIADMATSNRIEREHLSEALGYRLKVT